MRISFIADVHLENHRAHGGPTVAGINARATAVLQALRGAAEVARDRNSSAFVVLGDLFDTTRPAPQLLAAAGRALAAFAGPVYLLMGNHDQQSPLAGDHALGPLALGAGVEVVEKPTVVQMSDAGDDLVLVPFETGAASAWLPARLAEILSPQPSTRCVTASTGRRVLALHLGIHDRDIRDRFAWAGRAADAVSVEQLAELCRAYRIDAVVAGNWHGRQLWEYHWPDIDHRATIMQVGALVPTGWDNAGLDGYGTVALYDRVHGLSYTEVAGPRFVKASSEAEVVACLDRGRAHRLYVRWTCGPDAVAHARRYLDGLCEDDVIEGYTVRVDQADAKVAAQVAASAARSSGTLAEAVDGFVQAMALPADVDRDEVLSRVREYLGVGG